MCTVVLLYRPDHDWPLILAANRDEMVDRPWSPPGRHWPDRGNVIAGIDRLAGGTWLGINDEGVVAGVLNRRDSLGSDPSLRSRGELPLEALDHADAACAAEALSRLDGRSYRSFNMVIADNRDAFWLKSQTSSTGVVERHEISPGISMLTACDLNDTASERIAHFLPLFEVAPAPDPDTGDWRAWETLLSSTERGAYADPRDAMRITTDDGFGTLSSALIALPAVESPSSRTVWLFSASPPGTVPFEPVPA